MRHDRLKIVADDNIPFLKGRLEPFADVTYTGQFGFTPEMVRNADALLIRTRTRCDEQLLGGSDVSLVATATIGMDQIDIPWCEANGIEVRNSPGCNAPGVAQYVWSSLLRLGMKPGTHTIGVVGHGNVGTIVAAWGEAMGFDVILCDPPKAERLRNEGRADEARRYVPLDELIRKSDAVTLHTPLTRGGDHPTFHLIDDKVVPLMRPGQILVNAARGPVVGNDTFLSAIGKGVRAVIDTWEGEPALDRRLLEKAEIGTFHIAGYSLEGKQRATRMVLEAVDNRFGTETDKSGLAPAWENDWFIEAERILESYDPFADDRALREAPEDFDRLRGAYNYRPEPQFKKKITEKHS